MSRAQIWRKWGQIVAAMWLSAGPGHAQFAVCNQTFDVLNIAIARFQGDSFHSEGWWTVGPNQCANVIDDVLRVRYVYVFAQDVFGRVVLSGAAPMCVSPDRFEIPGNHDCLLRGHIDAGFVEVDTRLSERWTYFIYPPPE